MTLRYLESHRVYTADDEIPQRTLDRALQIEAEGFEPSFITDSAVDYGQELAKGAGIRIVSGKREGPYWSLNPDEIAVQMECIDVEAFLSSEWATDFDDGDKERIRAVERENGIAMRTDTGSRGDRTEPDFAADDRLAIHDEIGEDCGGDWDRSTVRASLDKLEEAWSEAVSEIAGKMLASVVADVEYQTSEEALRERMRDCDEGLTEDGRMVPLADCKEGPEDEDED